MADRSKLILWGLVITAVLAFSCLGACLGSAFFCGKSAMDAKGEAEGTARLFLTHAQAGRWGDAYSLASDRLRKEAPEEALRDRLAPLAMEGGTLTLTMQGLAVRVGIRSDAQVAFVMAPADPRDGGPVSGEVSLVRDPDAPWRVDAVRVDGTAEPVEALIDGESDASVQGDAAW